MTDSLYTVAVPTDLVDTIEYNLRDTLGTAVLDLIATHPTRDALAAIVAAARVVNPTAVITDDGIEIAPDDCYDDGVAYPEHDFSGYDSAICRRCGAECDPIHEVFQILPEDDDAPVSPSPSSVPLVCRNTNGDGFTSHDFTPDGLGKTCRRCDIPREDFFQAAELAAAEAAEAADDFDIGSRWVDAHGRPIRTGDPVRQANVYDPDRGSLYANTLAEGRVTGYGRTRVLVDFGRTNHDGKVIDRIAPDLLVVQTATDEV